MRRNVAWAMPLIILSFLFLSVIAHSAQSAPKKGGMVTVGLTSDVTAVDPHTSPVALNTAVLNHVFERLVGCNEDLEVVPILAEKYEASPDLKTFTFYLRKGKLFHNGREMIADDVKYSIERLSNPKTGNPRWGDWKNIQSIEVVDKYTVRFHLKEGDYSIFYTLGTMAPIAAIVPREEVEKQGGLMKHPVGTGPYKFVEWKPDRYLLLERFDKYKPQPGPMSGNAGEQIAYLDKIKFVPVPEESVATMALLNKEIDMLQYVPYKDVEKFQKEYAKRGIVLDEKLSEAYYLVLFGLNNPVTNNVKFRQACAYAIDQNLVTQTATRGHAAVNPSFIPTTSPLYTPAHKKWYPKDVNKAKQMLKESGYKGEVVEIMTTKKYPMMYSMGIVVQSELEAIGVKTKLNVVEWGILNQTHYKGNHQIITIGFSPPTDQVRAYEHLSYKGFYDQYPHIKEIMSKVSKTMDPETQKKLFEEAHNMVYDYVPAIMCFNYNTVNAYWNYVKGFKIWKSNIPRLTNVWIEK